MDTERSMAHLTEAGMVFLLVRLNPWSNVLDELIVVLVSLDV
jgi:hypothetical protein